MEVIEYLFIFLLTCLSGLVIIALIIMGLKIRQALMQGNDASRDQDALEVDSE